MIDKDGYRYNVGIIISNDAGQLLLAKRCRRKHAWQFPQGGMRDSEKPEEAMYRELTEELGLLPESVNIISMTKQWHSYRLPIGYWRLDSEPLVVGQKQKWFLLKLLVPDTAIDLDYTSKPEFDAWEWVNYWEPLSRVIDFKRDVYQSVLTEFEPIIQAK